MKLIILVILFSQVLSAQEGFFFTLQYLNIDANGYPVVTISGRSGKIVLNINSVKDFQITDEKFFELDKIVRQLKTGDEIKKGSDITFGYKYKNNEFIQKESLETANISVYQKMLDALGINAPQMATERPLKKEVKIRGFLGKKITWIDKDKKTVSIIIQTVGLPAGDARPIVIVNDLNDKFIYSSILAETLFSSEEKISQFDFQIQYDFITKCKIEIDTGVYPDPFKRVSIAELPDL